MSSFPLEQQDFETKLSNPESGDFDNSYNNNGDTYNTNSNDSKVRPIQIGASDSNHQSDCDWNPNERQQTHQLEANTLQSHTRESIGELGKSDSLDSARVACCNRLASNIYHKALESAKKALPKHKQKDSRYQFPRSFGEDFGSIGPDAFNYFDDSQTECSGSYKDIDFNRDSYYGGPIGVIPEENMAQKSSASTIPEQEQQHQDHEQSPQRELLPPPDLTVIERVPLNWSNEDSIEMSKDNKVAHEPELPEEKGSVEEEEDERDYIKPGSLEDILGFHSSPDTTQLESVSEKNQTDNKKARKRSFIGRIFHKRDRSVDSKTSKSGKSKKKSSSSRGSSVEKSASEVESRGQSMPPSVIYGGDISETERSLIEELNKRSPSPATGSQGGAVDTNEDNLVVSNISRQSPVHLVYGKPPDIYVEECSTLPRNSDDLAAQHSQQILADVLNQMSANDPNAQVSYANIDWNATHQHLQEALDKENQQKNDGKKAKKSNAGKRFFKKFGKSNKPDLDGVPAFAQPNQEGNVEQQQQPLQVTLSAASVGDNAENVEDQQEETNENIHNTTVQWPSVDEPLANASWQTEAELLQQQKPLPQVPSNKSKKGVKLWKDKNKNKDYANSGEQEPTTSGSGKQSKKILAKKDNFKLKDKLLKNKQAAVAAKQKREQMKQQKSFEAFARRQLPTLPESRQSTLNSMTHVYEGILSPPSPAPPVDEFGNVYIDVGQPIEPGKDYFVHPMETVDPVEAAAILAAKALAEAEAAAKAAEEEEANVKKNSKLDIESSDKTLNVCDDDLSVVVTPDKNISTPSQPPRIVDVVPATDEQNQEPPQINDPTMVGFQSDHPIIIGQIAIFEKLENVQDKEIGVTYEPPLKNESEELEQPQPDNGTEPKKSKGFKLKNMMGSLGQSVRAKVKDIKVKVKKSPDIEDDKQSVELESQKRESTPIHGLKETDLDGVETDERAHFHQMTPTMVNTEPEPTQAEIKVNVEEVHVTSVSSPSEPIMYEADLEDASMVVPDDEEPKKKKMKRKLKLVRNKKEKKQVVEIEPSGQPADRHELTPEPDGILAAEERKPSWSEKNRVRLERLRSRAAESFTHLRQSLVEKTKRKTKKSDGLYRGDIDSYEYEFKVASDSELSPGTGVDSLRRTKVYQELAGAQERLELYMSPVGVAGPLRPPRSNNRTVRDYNRSMPSLVTSANGRRRLPPPPRPPPPRVMQSYNSVPVIVPPADDEISLSTSMSSLWTRGGSRRTARATRHQQRVPADLYYRNVRLFYRPKKSYMEMLERSQPFYSMASLHRSQSVSHLPPVPPTRAKSKSKSLFSKRATTLCRNATVSPPPPPSRSSLVSGYGEFSSPPPGSMLCHYADLEVEDDEINLAEIAPHLVATKELYEKYEPPRSPIPNDPLAWQPFSWKVKRCRSLTEIDVRGRLMKQARQSQERELSVQPINANLRCQRSPTPSEYGTITGGGDGKGDHDSNHTYSQRIFSWLASTTSLDAWRRNKAVKRSASSCGKPPRPPPPLPPARSKHLTRPSSPSTTISSSAIYFSYPPTIASTTGSTNTLVGSSNAINTCATNLTAKPLSPITAFAGRPLPPPPVPPRPKFIPAHYATRSLTPVVEKRDCAVDTSENGFQEYISSSKEVQVKLPSLSRPDSLASESSVLDRYIQQQHRHLVSRSVESEADLDDEATIVEEKPLFGSTSYYHRHHPVNHRQESTESKRSLQFDIKEVEPESTVTSATVYMDARSRLTDQATQSLNLHNEPQQLQALDTSDVKQEPPLNHRHSPQNEWSDDDTINDDLSSLASNYQSVCSSIHSAASSGTPAGNSWLHRQATAAATVATATSAAAADQTNVTNGASEQVFATPMPDVEATTTSFAASISSSQDDEYVSAYRSLSTGGGGSGGGGGANIGAVGDVDIHSNRSSLISQDPIMEEEEEEAVDFEQFQRAFSFATVPIVEEGQQQLEQSQQQQDSTKSSQECTTTNETNGTNRQSVISTSSNTSSDTFTSTFNVTHSSTSSSFSSDSSALITSLPQATVTTGSASSCSVVSSKFYTTTDTGTITDRPIDPNTGDVAIVAAVEANESDNGKNNGDNNDSSSSTNEINLDHLKQPQQPKSLVTLSTEKKQVMLSQMQQSLPENIASLPTATPKGAEPDKRYFLSYELYTTERDYVDVLRMLTHDFRNAISPVVSKYFLDKFFRPLDVVLPINEKLLSELHDRVLKDWDDQHTITDIMIKICPYFKEYSIFVRDFDKLNYMLDEAGQMFPNFNEKLVEFQNLDRCKKLSIKNYLLKPIQRLPQYPLLLQTFFKRLKPDDNDYEQAKEALRVVTEVVEHINRESLMAEKSLQLTELKNRIISKCPDSIVKPGRELIKEGFLHKVSRKEVHERYFILFNDAFLYLVPVMNDMIRLKEEFPLDKMEVEISKQEEHEFVIRSVRRSFALLARNAAEREDWVLTLENAIADYKLKKSSFEAAKMQPSYSSSVISSSSSLDLIMTTSLQRSSPDKQNESGNDHSNIANIESDIDSITSLSGANKELLYGNDVATATIDRHRGLLGDRAPVWVHDRRVTMCQRCTREFTILYRRHHCRACGFVVCASCSNQNHLLKYCAHEGPQRVCDVCYEELVTNEQYNRSDSAHSSRRVSPNHSITSADSVKSNERCKNRSNSCTDLDRQLHWTEIPPALTISGVPLSKNTLMDKNSSSFANSFTLALSRNQHYRLSSRARKMPAVLVEVPANDANALISGYLQQLSTKKTWKRYWFLIKDMVLYTYRAREDVAALDSLPLPGYNVSTSKEPVKGHPARLIIELSHPGRSTKYFYTENADSHMKWLHALRHCAEILR